MDVIREPNRRNFRPTVFFPGSNEGIILHVSENAWRPSFKVEYIPGEGTVLEELTKRVRGILNKLTPQNFQTLVSQVKHELGIDTEEKLKILVNLIFENALNAPKYSVPFANLCKSLALIRVPQDGSGGMVHFRKLLLTKCQQEFEKDRNDELQTEERKNTIEAVDADKKMQMEFVEHKKKIRMRQLGNIRFIGELFKLSMIIEPIMHEYIKTFLSQGNEESLEYLCCLLKTIGKKLEKIGTKNRKDSHNPMDQYFDEIQKIVDRKMTSSRVYFMLQDVIDLRKDNWIPRRDEDYPKTIDQIHKEAEVERFNLCISNVREAQRAYLNMSDSNECPLDDQRKLPGSNLEGHHYVSEDGWTPISNRNVGYYSEVDPSKAKLAEKHELTVGEVNSKSNISIDKIRDKLKELLSENGENETIFDWIDANVPPSAVNEPIFIRALALEVHKASIIESDMEKKLDQDTLKKRLPLLIRFINHNNYLELQALYAVQHLLNDLNQPKGVLREIFDLLYDDDVITEETFKMWQQCKDPSEQEGKEVALKSVKGFFTWLREAESEEDLENE